MQKTSSYNKIREILETGSKHSGEINELAKSIRENNKAFVYYKRDEDDIIREYPFGLSTIKRKIRFCIELELIRSEEDCTLTDTGRNAIAKGKGRFDLQLQQAIINFLDDKAPIQDIETAIDELILSDTSSLYKYLAPNLTPEVFRNCLFLLSECGEDTGQNVLKPFDKKLYLTEAKIEKSSALLKKGKK
jgi:hypothetical protein